MPPNLQNKLAIEQIEKTIKEVRKNIARRERVAFANGILWCVYVTWIGMIMTYLIGSNINPGIMLGSFGYGLWCKFRKEK